MDDQLLFMLCLTGAIGFLGFYGARFFVTRDDGKLRDRLANKRADATPRPTQSTGNRFKEILRKFGTAASKPFLSEDREKVSALRKKLNRAGIYTPSSIKLVTGMKVICLIAGLFAGYAVGLLFENLFLGISMGGLVGYVAPAVWISFQISKNQKALDHALPDALDLMVICIESGLAVDAAMQRVGSEIALAHPQLARELDITHMETRVGVSRSESLKNMGHRTGNPAIQALVSMLVQAERFGTSISSALKVHAETLRTQRQYKAEEMAAKASVKLSLPLVMFIFPATFIVLAGPTVIGLMRSSLFNT